MEKASSSKRPRYNAALRAEALQLASESHSTLAAARALNINAQLLYPVAESGSAALTH
jgi:transposase